MSKDQRLAFIMKAADKTKTINPVLSPPAVRWLRHSRRYPMTHPESVRPVTVTRDRNGFWTHPHYFAPASDEATQTEFGDWMRQHNDLCHPLDGKRRASQVIADWEKGKNISDWLPSAPEGRAGSLAPFMTLRTARSVWLREVK
jgi:hypothetical protein